MPSDGSGCAFRHVALAIALCMLMAFGSAFVWWASPLDDIVALVRPAHDGAPPTIPHADLTVNPIIAAALTRTPYQRPYVPASVAVTTVVDPVAWVRQWHLAPPASLYKPVEAEIKLPESLLAISTKIISIPHRCSVSIHHACVDSDHPMPSAHRVGLSNLPTVLTPPLGASQIRDIFPDPAQRTFMTFSITPPWRLRLTVVATRFDLNTGDFHIMMSFDDVVTQMNGTAENEICHGSMHSVRDRKRIIWDHLQRTGTAMRCVFDRTDPGLGAPKTGRDIGDTVVTPASDFIMGVTSDVIEARCAYPWFPRAPPDAINITFKIAYSASMWPTPPPAVGMVVPMRASLDRRVPVAHCGKPMANAQPLGFLMDFIQHHAMLGVEVFHIYDRYNQASVHARLEPHIRSGLVQLHQAAEHTHFYTRADPTEMSIYYSQVAYQEICRFRNFASAEYLAIWDFDEYLNFPQVLRMEDVQLDYVAPNGHKVHADRIEQLPPACMKRNRRTGLVQMDYSEVDAANAIRDAEAGRSREQLVADTLHDRSQYARHAQCTSMITRFLDACRDMHSQAFKNEPGGGAARSKLPWFVSIHSIFHGIERPDLAQQRAAFVANIPQLMHEGRNPQPSGSHADAASTVPSSPLSLTSSPSSSAATCAELPRSVAFVTSFGHDTLPSDLLSSTSLNESAIASHCFMREEFQYSPLMRFPIEDPTLPWLPKFLMQTRARAASWVHWPTAELNEMREHSWSLVLRNFRRRSLDAQKHETRVTVHAPPIAELMHFYNVYRLRGAGPKMLHNNRSHPVISAEETYRTMMTHLDQLPCVDDQAEQ